MSQIWVMQARPVHVRQRHRPIIGLVGLLMFGLVLPVTSTTWARPPEIDFALAIADVRAAAEARGGAIGSLKSESAAPTPIP
ncbi:hypothetical protein [Kribbella sancticallisti]